jgi:hypothetical protein
MYSRNKHASIKNIVEKYSRAENAAARNNAAIRMAEGVQRNAAIRMAKGVQRNAEKRIMAVQQRDFEKLLRDLKPNSQRSIPNSNTLVQNAGKFNFSNQLKEVGFTLQPGGKSTTVLGGVTKQNKARELKAIRETNPVSSKIPKARRRRLNNRGLGRLLSMARTIKHENEMQRLMQMKKEETARKTLRGLAQITAWNDLQQQLAVISEKTGKNQLVNISNKNGAINTNNLQATFRNTPIKEFPGCTRCNTNYPIWVGKIRHPIFSREVSKNTPLTPRLKRSTDTTTNLRNVLGLF